MEGILDRSCLGSNRVFFFFFFVNRRGTIIVASCVKGSKLENKKKSLIKLKQGLNNCPLSLSVFFQERGESGSRKGNLIIQFHTMVNSTTSCVSALCHSSQPYQTHLRISASLACKIIYF
jgi:hypothetical protein